MGSGRLIRSSLVQSWLAALIGGTRCGISSACPCNAAASILSLQVHHEIDDDQQTGRNAEYPCEKILAHVILL